MIFLLPLELRQAAARATAPVANYVLIAVNVLFFLLGWSWPVGHGTGLASILLYAFSHFNLWHLVLNLWTLWVFGNPVNRRLGNGYYAAAYVATAIVIGLACRWACPGPAVGASGAIFAVMTVAMILMPSARLEVAYLVLFPITVLLGLLVRPRRNWLEWFVRWGVLALRMFWCLVLIPVILFLELILGRIFWGAWDWGTAGHLLGVICGLGIVLLLPTAITMPGRAARSGILAG